MLFLLGSFLYDTGTLMVRSDLPRLILVRRFYLSHSMVVVQGFMIIELRPY